MFLQDMTADYAANRVLFLLLTYTMKDSHMIFI